LPQFSQAQNAASGQFQNAGGGQFENFNQPLARNLVGRTLAGQFLDPFQNPGLQGVLDRGGNFIQNRLNTDFAGAGRNLGAARPAAADLLGTFTSNTLFNNFNAERARQQNALGSVQSFDPTQQFFDRLNALSAAAQGNSTSTAPFAQDRVAGALGGLQTGQAIGDILGGIFKGSGSGSGGFGTGSGGFGRI
jgi:hypothetical protein